MQNAHSHNGHFSAEPSQLTAEPIQPRRNSLVDVLKAIRFPGNGRRSSASENPQGFAQPHPRARQRRALAEERSVVRSAN